MKILFNAFLRKHQQETNRTLCPFIQYPLLYYDLELIHQGMVQMHKIGLIYIKTFSVQCSPSLYAPGCPLVSLPGTRCLSVPDKPGATLHWP